MRQVASLGQAHAQDGIAGLDRRHIHRLVCLGAGVRLHVHCLRAKELLGTVDGDLLHDVDKLASTVVALAGITLSILVCELGPLRLHDGRACVVLRCDQLNMLFLASILLLNGGPQMGVNLIQGAAAVKHGGIFLSVRDRSDCGLAWT
ncbi:hypothetical protein D3C79_753920 [compost metagenome]